MAHLKRHVLLCCTIFSFPLALHAQVSPTIPPLTAQIISPPAGALPTYFTEKSSLILARVDTGAELSEGLMSARILFGEGMRRTPINQNFIGLAEEISNRSFTKVNALPRTTADTRRTSLSKSKDLIETLANTGAHAKLVAFFEAQVKPFEGEYKIQPAFGSLAAHTLEASYAVQSQTTKWRDYGAKLLGDNTIPTLQRAPIAVAHANNLVSAGAVTEALTHYRNAITWAAAAPVAAQAYFWVALKKLTEANTPSTTAEATALAVKGITALGTPVFAWEKELLAKLTEIKNTPRTLTGRNAKDLEIVRKG